MKSREVIKIMDKVRFDYEQEKLSRDEIIALAFYLLKLTHEEDY